MIQREGVGRVCTDYSVDTLQRLAVELAALPQRSHYFNSGSY